jgi:Tfp pilus assembly protein PilO
VKGKGRGALFSGLGGAALILVLVAGLILPKANQVRQRQHDLADAKHKQQTLTVQLEQLRGAAKDFKKNQRQLRILEQEVPETAQLPSIITLINAAADESAVDFMSISPQVPAEGTTVSTVPTQISVIGEYFAVDEFLFKLESLPRVAKVINITVSPNGSSDAASAAVGSTGPLQLKVDLLAEFYTTDLSAGPGSSPGHTEATQLAPAPGASPSASPSPSGG